MKEEFKKIAVLRPSALGDLILTFPALEALRAKFKDSEIVLIGKESHKDFCANLQTPFDRIIPIPLSMKFDNSLLSFSSSHETFFELLRSEGFDLGIQLFGGGAYSNFFMKKIGAKLTLGAKSENALPLDISLPYTQFQHEVVRQLNIVEKVGASTDQVVPQIHLKSSYERCSSPFILINPGATDPKRRWPTEKFRQLCQYFIHHKIQIKVNLGPEEDEIKKHLMKAISQDSCLEFISPKLSELTDMISQAQLVVSNDTGTAHLAQALRVPTVSLFWFKNLVNYGPLRSEANRVLTSWESHCPTCGINNIDSRCEHDSSLIESISVSDVLKACEVLLKEKGVSYEH